MSWSKKNEKFTCSLRLNVAPGLSVLKLRTSSSTPRKRNIGMMAGTSDSPTSRGARRGLCQIPTFRPSRASNVAKVLATGPPPIMAMLFIFPAEWFFIAEEINKSPVRVTHKHPRSSSFESPLGPFSPYERESVDALATVSRRCALHAARSFTAFAPDIGNNLPASIPFRSVLRIGSKK